MSLPDPFRGLEPTRAPQDLRDRVLASARRAAAEPRPGLVDRLWSSTGLRLAWVGCVLVLLVANLTSTGPAPTAGPSLAPQATAETGLPLEVRELLPTGWQPHRTSATAADRRLLDQVLTEPTWDLS